MGSLIVKSTLYILADVSGQYSFSPSPMFENDIEHKINFNCENAFPLTGKKAGLEKYNMSRSKT